MPYISLADTVTQSMVDTYCHVMFCMWMEAKTL